ncbi:hypothetical protein ILUMI_15174, partial [Ignelater luminosus]
MDSFALSPLQPLNLTGNVSHYFKLWLQRFQIYLKANNLDKETEERQVNSLLNYIGDKCITVFNSFNLTNVESKSIKTVIDKFTDHFAPKKHLSLLRHNFFARKQKSDEPFEDYSTTIINLGLQCDLGALREELTKAKIISGLDSKYDDLRTRLMAEEDKTLTLSYVTKYLKTAESSRQAVTQMQKDNRVDVFPMSEDVLLAKSKGTHGINKRPAYEDKIKNQDFKSNSMSKFIPKQRKNIGFQINNGKNSVHQFNVDYNNQDEYLIGTTGMVNGQRKIFVVYTVNNCKIKLKIDTGAMCNLLSYNDYKCIGLTDKLLQKCYKKIIQLEKSNVPVVGSAMIPLVNKNNETKLLEFIVVNVECPPILGLQASIDLNLITYHINM